MKITLVILFLFSFEQLSLGTLAEEGRKQQRDQTISRYNCRLLLPLTQYPSLVWNWVHSTTKTLMLQRTARWTWIIWVTKINLKCLVSSLLNYNLNWDLPLRQKLHIVTKQNICMFKSFFPLMNDNWT